jgi:Flp pilus assembly protein TadG
MIGRIHFAARSRAGTAALEFALLMPLLLTMFLGCFEVFEVVDADIKLDSTARAMANLVAQEASVSSSDLSDICVGGQLMMLPFPGSTLSATIASVTNSGGIAEAWQDTSCGSATGLSGSAVSNAAAMAPKIGDSVIVVQATYTYTSPIGYVLPATFKLSQIAYARPRNVAAVAKN